MYSMCSIQESEIESIPKWCFGYVCTFSLYIHILFYSFHIFIYHFIHLFVKYIFLQLKTKTHAVHLSGHVKISLKKLD